MIDEDIESYINKDIESYTDEDIELYTDEDGLSFLEIIDYRQYLLIVYWIIIFG
jgi:hypothetical protein